MIPLKKRTERSERGERGQDNKTEGAKEEEGNDEKEQEVCVSCSHIRLMLFCVHVLVEQ